MNRTFDFLGDLTEDGFVHHDRDDVRTCLLDLEGAIFQLGGIMTMAAIREQIAPGQFLTTGVRIAYDSYSPAVEREQVAANGPVESEETSTP